MSRDMIIDLHPTEDQQMIADSIGGFLADRLPVARLRESESHAGAAESEIWSDLAELGVFGIGLSEDEGGTGYGLPEEVLAARALGRALASPSLLAQMAAVHLAEGDARAALVTGESRAAFATPSLSGDIIVLDNKGADLIVLLAQGASLLPVDSFEWEQVASIDETILIQRAANNRDLPDERDAKADRISLLIASSLTGVAQGALELAVDYAKQREQFGQPIGSFQAIKHSLADMRVRADCADTQTRVAAVAFGRSEADRREVAAARWLAGDAALGNAKAGIQVHGGMGFTAECDAHLYLKRAHVLSGIGSSTRAEERRLLAG